MKNKIGLKIFAYILLITITFGYAIIGIVTFPTYSVEFKGYKYKEASSDVYSNRKNHHIYVSNNYEDSELTITIENDNAVITILNFSEFKIEKNDVEVTGNFQEVLETESTHAFKDYYELVRTYYDHENIHIGFPVPILFPFFAIFPFIFGLIMLLDLFKKREKKISTVHLVFRSLTIILFVLTLSFEILVVSRYVFYFNLK